MQYILSLIMRIQERFWIDPVNQIDVSKGFFYFMNLESQTKRNLQLFFVFEDFKGFEVQIVAYKAKQGLYLLQILIRDVHGAINKGLQSLAEGICLEEKSVSKILNQTLKRNSQFGDIGHLVPERNDQIIEDVGSQKFLMQIFDSLLINFPLYFFLTRHPDDNPIQQIQPDFSILLILIPMIH